MRKILPIIVILLTLGSLPSINAQTQSGTIASLWKGVGGKSKWNATDFILFTANGNDAHYLQNGRRFLINKKTGECRFEGRTMNNQNIVVLFNYKTEKLLRYFVNGKEEKKHDVDVLASFKQVNEQFLRDASLLFLPTLMDRADTRVGKVSSKIINAEKLHAVSFQLKDNFIAGDMLFNADDGFIRQLIDKEGNTFYVNGYKDIGGGLFLPTVFKNLQHTDRNTTFTTVAAFTDMEAAKFENL